MSATPLRVAHVVATAGRSGVESHLQALLPAFDPARVRARLFVPAPGPLVDALAARGFVAEIGAPSRKLAWGEARGLAARLRGQCDVLHAHGPRAAFWCAAVARWARIPRFVCTVHELRWRSLAPGVQRALWVLFESWAMQRADRLIVLSQDSGERLRQRFPGLASRFALVPGSTPMLLDERSLPRARPGDPATPLRVITVGRFQWGKRHDRVLEAVALAVARGVRIELYLAGDGPERGALEARARALGLGPQVHWPGESFEAPALLAQGHVYMSASLSEVCSVAAMEAMAIGLPVVTCENGGVSELVEAGRCGIVVRASSDREVVARLADALVELAADPSRRAALGEAAARSARETYSPVAMARATTAVYQSALAHGLRDP